jgi:mannose-1-phosphate guanylyltransferase
VRIDSNYGYIVAEGAEEAIVNVECFIEKPSFHVIQGLQNKHCYWNSGMFLFSVDTLLTEMKHYTGDVLEKLTQAYENTYKLQNGIEVLPEHYEYIPSLPLDKVIMEYSKKLKVIPVDMGWADVGSWQSLWEFTNENINDNINPPLHNGHKECSNCLAYLNKRLALSVY